MTEFTVEWKQIPGFDPRYYISNDGQIYSAISERVLSPVIHDGRYLKAQFKKEGKLKKLFIHGLVAEAFLGPRPPGFTVNHKDGNRMNNRWTNLEYVTMGANLQHAWDNGLRERKWRLNEQQRNEVRNLWPELGYRKIAKLYGVSTTAVRSALKQSL